ncbi:Phage derived protein Gp49-like [Azotobacter beijerinckii]|uniref:Phage derived protein Gp49-like n=2 Tax=Azotobacter beijerinckii TaxID=170623 RepID=A0A1H6VFC0_9GAMM|nr:Phage derived protein Gp49-like [Azotobacter beijerinckii]
MERDGRSQVEVFLDDLGSNFGSNADGILAMMEAHSEHGPEHFNTSQCHYVDQKEQIYEYIKGRLRLFWFEDDDRVVVCTHGIVKKDQKTPKRDIERAKRVKADYLQAKQENRLEFETEE